MKKSTKDYITGVAMEMMILNELGVKSNYRYREIKGLFQSLVFWEEGKVRTNRTNYLKNLKSLTKYLTAVLEKTKNRSPYLTMQYIEIVSALQKAETSLEIEYIFNIIKRELYIDE